MYMSPRKCALATLAAIALCSIQSESGYAAERTIKLSHLNPPNVFEATSAAATAVFKQTVESGTNGTIKVQLFHSGQLGKDQDIIQQVRDGVIQSHIASVGGIALHYPLIDVLSLPFVYPGLTSAFTVLDGPFGKTLAKDIEAKTGLKVLAFTDNGGFMHITNSKRPIEKIEDLKGLRIRTMTIKAHEDTMSSLGAQPYPLAWAELYTALQTGVVDGQMNPLSLISAAKFDEVQRYLTLTGHLYVPHVWVMNRKFYESLSDDERNIVTLATEAAKIASRGVGVTIDASEHGIPKLAKRMKVNSLPSEQRAKFREASFPIVAARIKKSYGAEGERLLDLFVAEVNKTKQ